MIVYFTGKECIFESDTDVGMVSVHHRPSCSLGGPSGVSIKNRLVVSIELSHPVAFNNALNKMHDVSCFLSVLAGRFQPIEQIHLTLADPVAGMPESLHVHQSYRQKIKARHKQHKPSPGDIPLNPIQRRSEFTMVFLDWLRRHSEWRVARERYLGCLRKGNEYGVDRLVAAANMFDILPAEAVPNAAKLSDELVSARDECRARFRKLQPGIDRDSVLNVLGRVGKASLPKKIAHRTAIVEAKLGHKFPDLQFVLGVAVKCRNFFVHGNSEDIDYLKVEPLMPFLTNALEFVFAASDLIEAGWDAKRWSADFYGNGHSFARFRGEYKTSLSELRQRTSAERT